MTPSPLTIRQDVLAAEAVALMEARRINTLLVVDAAGVLVGAVSTNDLMRAKVI
jgi:arabinose-5-phosphate isomerase